MASAGMELILELNEQRGNLVEQARSHIKGDDVTAEDLGKFDEIMAEADKIGDRVKAEERAIAAEAELVEKRKIKAVDTGKTTDQVIDEENRDMRLFNVWLRAGAGNPNLTPEDRMEIAARLDPEFGTQYQNVQQTTTDAGGAYTVPDEFDRTLREALLAYGGMREVATVMTTATGATMFMPTTNDTSNSGAIVDEGDPVTEQDIVFAQQTIGSFMYTSKMIRVSHQLMQDSAFDLASHIAKVCGTRIGRITNTHFTTGAGTTLPFGIVTGAVEGKVGTTGQTLTIIYDDFIDMEHSIDPAYRSMGCKWMLNDSSLKAAKKLVDGNDLPLWQPGLAYGAPDTILNYPYVINQDIAVMAANAKSILFGKLDEYLIRDVLGIKMMRLNERYAEYLQTAFFAFSRHDGLLLNAGGNPVKYYANSAT